MSRATTVIPDAETIVCRSCKKAKLTAGRSYIHECAAGLGWKDGRCPKCQPPSSPLVRNTPEEKEIA